MRYLSQHLPARRCAARLALAVGVLLAVAAATATSGTILGTKHDFTGLNLRAGVVAMPTVAFSDYGNACIYCHVPPGRSIEEAAEQGAILGWNRYSPAAEVEGVYTLYDSATLDNKVRTPSPISLLCLSCHDGTMGVDMTVFKPNGWRSSDDAAMHMRINGADDLWSCGKCHDGRIAHNIAVKHLDTDLSDDHPISMTYAGLNFGDRDFRRPDGPYGFDNGVKLYEDRVECASCHNVHDPDITLLLRERADRLCETCHIK